MDYLFNVWINVYILTGHGTCHKNKLKNFILKIKKNFKLTKKNIYLNFNSIVNSIVKYIIYIYLYIYKLYIKM